MNNADKELLQLAAKAAGNGVQWDCHERGMMVLTPDGIDTVTWNPRDDNAQAFELAATLNLSITQMKGMVTVQHGNNYWTALSLKSASEAIPMDADAFVRLAATRLAVLRVAAEIGRAMP